MRSEFLFILFSAVLYYPVFSEDYYQLLGISRDASNKEIRKAFKKLALKFHPDKNKGESAHETFTKISKAYEVLKDGELRKKYDLYGEEGLKDNHFGGGHYQSWNYFNEEFGIYDDDPEIITLSYSDFQVSVSGSEDIWFINFYSPYCSHCHTLAPTWREVARELEGVIRIGAVNCQEDWGLCRHEQIQSYPSLKLYPTQEVYYGKKTTEAIVQFILSSLDIRIFDFTLENFESQINQFSELPWLIDFCDHHGGDCLSHDTKIKVSAILDNLVFIGSVDCSNQRELCQKMGYLNDLIYFRVGEVQQGKGIHIESLETKEIVTSVLNLTPELKNLDEKAFEEVKTHLKGGGEDMWVIHFDQGPVDSLEMRKLPAVMPEMNVGHVDCRKDSTLCRSLHIHKYPVAALFKTGGSYEWHHGRYTAHDIAVFAKESATSKVQTLAPEDFPGHVIKPDHPFFVDFFAPWCPPCMRLLPEYRKAARSFVDRDVSFGTVDCTVHSSLCHKYNIRSYPTTILYNNSIPHQFVGSHRASDIVDFVENTLRPSVIVLTPAMFQSLVAEKGEGETWLVDFYAPWCGPCQELAPTWNKLAKRLQGDANVGSVDCQKYRSFCQTQDIRSYPTVRMYPHHSSNPWDYVDHRGWRDLDSLYAWTFQHLPSSVIELNHQSFYESVVLSEEPWLVDFYTPWCGHCVRFAPEFERVSKMLEGIATAAKVNCEQYNHLCSQAGIQMYPTIRLYLGSRSGMSQSLGGDMNIDVMSASSIKQVVEDAVTRRHQETPTNEDESQFEEEYKESTHDHQHPHDEF